MDIWPSGVSPKLSPVNVSRRAAPAAGFSHIETDSSASMYPPSVLPLLLVLRWCRVGQAAPSDGYVRQARLAKLEDDKPKSGMLFHTDLLAAQRAQEKGVLALKQQLADARAAADKTIKELEVHISVYATLRTGPTPRGGSNATLPLLPVLRVHARMRIRAG